MSELMEQVIKRVNELAGMVESLDRFEHPAILARYSTDAGQSIPNVTDTIVDFEDIAYDPDGLVTTGANWHFTAVTAGYYGMSAMILFTATTTWADAEAGALDLYKNGALFSHLDRKDSYGSTSSVYMALGGDDLVYLGAGDTLDVRVSQLSGAALALHNNGLWNHVAIWKV